MKVRDAMTEHVLTITPGRSLREAARFMTDHNVGAVVIIDPEEPGPGIVTERDLVRSLGSGEDPDNELVRDHLTSNADNVGKKFPEEARKMHYGETEHRSIYGEATAQDAKALHEEGIEFQPLPVLPDERN